MWSVFSEPVDDGVVFNADPLSSAMCFIFLLVCNFNMFNGTIGRCLTTNNNRRRGMMMMIEELIYTLRSVWVWSDGLSLVLFFHGVNEGHILS